MTEIECIQTNSGSCVLHMLAEACLVIRLSQFTCVSACRYFKTHLRGMPASGEGRNPDPVAALSCPQAHGAKPADPSAAAAHALAESTLHEHGAAACAAATRLALEGL